MFVNFVKIVMIHEHKNEVERDGLIERWDKEEEEYWN